MILSQEQALTVAQMFILAGSVGGGNLSVTFKAPEISHYIRVAGGAFITVSLIYEELFAEIKNQEAYDSVEQFVAAYDLQGARTTLVEL